MTEFHEGMTVMVTPAGVTVDMRCIACAAGLPDDLAQLAWYPGGISDIPQLPPDYVPQEGAPEPPRINHRGAIVYRGGKTSRFDDFARLLPHLKAWDAAREAQEAALAKAKAEREMAQLKRDGIL